MSPISITTLSLTHLSVTQSLSSTLSFMHTCLAISCIKLWTFNFELWTRECVAQSCSDTWVQKTSHLLSWSRFIRPRNLIFSYWTAWNVCLQAGQCHAASATIYMYMLNHSSASKLKAAGKMYHHWYSYIMLIYRACIPLLLYIICSADLQTHLTEWCLKAWQQRK